MEEGHQKKGSGSVLRLLAVKALVRFSLTVQICKLTLIFGIFTLFSLSFLPPHFLTTLRLDYLLGPTTAVQINLFLRYTTDNSWLQHNGWRTDKLLQSLINNIGISAFLFSLYLSLSANPGCRRMGNFDDRIKLPHMHSGR
jgi:hypothetical protein